MNDWRHLTHSQSLDAAALSAQHARDVMRGVCADALVSPPLTETALLLVSEVVTNAVVHGSGRPVLDIDVEPEVLRVTVTDDSSATPGWSSIHHVLAEGGRGLMLVEALATRWGTKAATADRQDRVVRARPRLTAIRYAGHPEPAPPPARGAGGGADGGGLRCRPCPRGRGR